MDENALKQILNQHFQSVAFWVVAVNTIGIILNAVFAFLLQRKLKGFEVKLNNIAAQDKTKFEHVYSERVVAIKELYRMYLILDHNASGFVLGRDFRNSQKPEQQKARANVESLHDAMQDAIKAITEYRRNNAMYLNDDIQNVVADYTSYCSDLPSNWEPVTVENMRVIFGEMDAKRNAIQSLFRKALGSDKL